MNNMKEVKIIQSKTEPNKNHLWLSDKGLKQFKGDGWEQVLSNDNGSSGDGNIVDMLEYKDLRNISNEFLVPVFNSMAVLTKAQSDKGISIGPVGGFGGSDDTILAIGISLDLPFISYLSTNIVTVKDALILNELLEDYNNLPNITKEQFYNLNE